MGFKMKGSTFYGSPMKNKVDLNKNLTGPKAEKTKVKDNNVYVDKNREIPLDPGYEDILKIQKVQRLGLTPHSQKFSKIAKRKKDDK